jgi:hypothetical protein
MCDYDSSWGPCKSQDSMDAADFHIWVPQSWLFEQEIEDSDEIDE